MTEIVKEGWAIKATMDGETVIRGGMFDGMRIKTNSWMHPDDIGIELPDGSIKVMKLADLEDGIRKRTLPPEGA
ncbi:MAG: hypothetical protein AB7T31_18330 [Gemmatimonadales bacterium]